MAGGLLPASPDCLLAFNIINSLEIIDINLDENLVCHLAD